MNYISTFDVQDIQVVNTTNEILCLSVTYVSGSIATGCHIELQCSNESLITFNITGTDGCMDTTGVNGVKTCLLRGYDIVNDDIEYSGSAVVMDDVPIRSEPTKTMTSPSASVPSTNPTGMIVIMLISCIVIIF
jgi:hypothetical protein